MIGLIQENARIYLEIIYSTPDSELRKRIISQSGPSEGTHRTMVYEMDDGATIAHSIINYDLLRRGLWGFHNEVQFTLTALPTPNPDNLQLGIIFYVPMP